MAYDILYQFSYIISFRESLDIKNPPFYSSLADFYINKILVL